MSLVGIQTFSFYEVITTLTSEGFVKNIKKEAGGATRPVKQKFCPLLRFFFYLYILYLPLTQLDWG